MKILVTGVTGRIGHNLAAALLNQGHEVRGLVMPNDPGLSRVPAGVTCITGNLRDWDIVVEAVTGMDVIYHLGAMMLWGSDDDNAILFEDNVRGTFNVFNAAALHGKGIKRVIYASSDEVYPSISPRYLPIDENHPTLSTSFYGVGKLMGENMGFYYHRAYGLPFTAARFALTTEPLEAVRGTGWLGRFLFLDPMIGTLSSRRPPEVAQKLKELRSGDETLVLPREEDGRPYMFHYCDVRDLVQGLVLMMEKEQAVGQAFNLSGPAPFSYDQAIPYLSRATSIPYVEIRLPGPPIRIEHSTAKARSLLGYAPQYTFFKTVDDGIALSKSVADA